MKSVLVSDADEPRRDDAFISYSREDRDFVRRLNDSLTSKGKSVWVDLEKIRPAADWQAKVEGGIEGAKSFVFVLSPDSVASKVCNEELQRARARLKQADRADRLPRRDTTTRP